MFFVLTMGRGSAKKLGAEHLKKIVVILLVILGTLTLLKVAGIIKIPISL